MSEQVEYPPRREGRYWLTEGGIETEIMYRWGFELPEFAMFALLDNPDAIEPMKYMWRRYLDVAAARGFDALMTGVDYRASPDWGTKVGYSAEGLAEIQHRCIAFLTDLRDEYADRIDEIVVSGCIGPRGDAYSLNKTITEAEAEDYHSVQIETLQETPAQMVSAMTFNSIPESIGVVRAASAAATPISMGINIGPNGRLRSGPTLREAIERIDEATAGAASHFVINCSHPDEFEPALEPGDWQRRVRSIRPNASRIEKIALCKLGHLEEGDPPELGRQMGDLAQRMPWMDIFGGCCGTGETHLDEIARNVREVREPEPA